MRPLIPALARTASTYPVTAFNSSEHSGQAIIQLKEAEFDWPRFRAWLKVLEEPREAWIKRTNAHDPDRRIWELPKI